MWCVEQHPDWYEAMRTKSSQLRALSLRKDKHAYASAIFETEEKFDIVIVDGIWRNECSVAALQSLKEGGFIIVNNSDWYTDVTTFLRTKGFLQVDFNGFGPINPYCWTTSLMFTKDVSLTHRFSQPHPVGGIEVVKGETW